MLITMGVAAALALSGAPALAAGKGQADAHGKGHRHHQSTVRGKSLRQVEGRIVSLATDGSSFAVQPQDSKALTVTVAITTSTVVTAEAGITPTLAVGEQVHVSGRVSQGTYWAVRVQIQKSAADADRKVGKPKH
ncbi:MAG TPA: DUF5666 domain-containing protein [Chloroflexota bacterium]|nr:DUF5666 domain-containing protein [Chloroflexota bacterium]